MKISRRKNNSPAKNATMAATKSRATGTEVSKSAKAPRNSVAITAQTSSAVTVQSVMARPMSRALAVDHESLRPCRAGRLLDIFVVRCGMAHMRL